MHRYAIVCMCVQMMYVIESVRSDVCVKLCKLFVCVYLLIIFVNDWMIIGIPTTTYQCVCSSYSLLNDNKKRREIVNEEIVCSAWRLLSFNCKNPRHKIQSIYIMCVCVYDVRFGHSQPVWSPVYMVCKMMHGPLCMVCVCCKTRNE